MEKIVGNIDSKKLKIVGTLSSANSPISGRLSSSDNISGNLSNLGIKGDSAYSVALKNGFEGSEEEWLESLKGQSVEVEVINSENGFLLKFDSAYGELITPEIYTNDYSPITIEQIDELLEGGGLIG